MRRAIETVDEILELHRGQLAAIEADRDHVVNWRVEARQKLYDETARRLREQAATVESEAAAFRRSVEAQAQIDPEQAPDAMTLHNAHESAALYLGEVIAVPKERRGKPGQLSDAIAKLVARAKERNDRPVLHLIASGYGSDRIDTRGDRVDQVQAPRRFARRGWRY